jgi:hypothetical protein
LFELDGIEASELISSQEKFAEFTPPSRARRPLDYRKHTEEQFSAGDSRQH